MSYIKFTLAIAPFWAIAVHFYAAQQGWAMFSQDWFDAAAMFSVYALIACVPAIMLVRLLMHFGVGYSRY